MKWRHAAAAGAEVLPGANIGLVHLLRSRGWHVTAGQPACEAWPASSTGRCNSQWDGGARPLLNADVLAALRSMGHGDELVVSDANFPADAIARQTVLGHILRMDGVDAPRAVRAILSVVPLDSFVEHPAMRMEVVDAPDEIPPVQREVQAEIHRAEGSTWTLAGIERMAFYERSKTAYCVIATGERRFYGCFILKKGVILPPEGEK